MIATLARVRARRVKVDDLREQDLNRLVAKGLVRVRFSDIGLTSIGDVALASFKLGKACA